MVADHMLAALALWAEADKQPLWLRIGPAGRLRVLAALLVIVTLGLLLLLFIRSFGRFMRSYTNRGASPPSPPATALEDDWAQLPLRDAEDDG